MSKLGDWVRVSGWLTVELGIKTCVSLFWWDTVNGLHLRALAKSFEHSWILVKAVCVVTHVVCGVAMLLLCLPFDCTDSQFARVSKSLQQQPGRCRKGQPSTLIYIFLLLSLTGSLFLLCFFSILFCWFLSISYLSLLSFYLFIHLLFPRCVLHGWITKLAVLTVVAVQFKTTHKYTNAQTLDTYSMLLLETTCNHAK